MSSGAGNNAVAVNNDFVNGRQPHADISITFGGSSWYAKGFGHVCMKTSNLTNP
jgi:hypothetical protein